MRLELSTRPEERIGDDEMWDRAEGALTRALDDRRALHYELNPGDGAFYGPKIDMHMTDSLGRSWQLGTVQLDYSMPERFGLSYTGADNAEHTPGDDPPRARSAPTSGSSGSCSSTTPASCRVWLAPVQAIVLPVVRSLQRLRRERREQPARAGAYVELDDRGESVGRKIRDAELRKIPYMLIVGERESAQGDACRCASTAAATPGAISVDTSFARAACTARAILGPLTCPQISTDARRITPA